MIICRTDDVELSRFFGLHRWPSHHMIFAIVDRETKLKATMRLFGSTMTALARLLNEAAQAEKGKKTLSSVGELASPEHLARGYELGKPGNLTLVVGLLH